MNGRVHKTHLQDVAISKAATQGTLLFVTHNTESQARNDKFSMSSNFDPNSWRKTARALERQWNLSTGAIAYVQETALVSLRNWRVVTNYAGVRAVSRFNRDV